jgi:hypothetical protein
MLVPGQLSAEVPSQGPEVHPDQIRRHLRDILFSSTFRRSRRCQMFLSFVVESALAGGADNLKERTIAVEVFGRPPTCDLGEDSIVRVGAREVRKRLAQYYQSRESVGQAVRIDIPAGSYAPEFRYVDEPVLAEEAPRELVVGRKHTLAWIAIPAVLLALLIVGTFALLKPADPEQENFQAFWAPILKTDSPLLIAVAHPIIYQPSVRALVESERGLPPLKVYRQRPVELPPERLNGSDWNAVTDQFVGYGDLVAAWEFLRLFSSRSEAPRLRLASKISFDDLREGPAVLIGAFTNRWTLEMNQDLRFQFQMEAGTVNPMIVDTADPSNHWGLLSEADPNDSHLEEDYVLVTRLINSRTGKLLVIAAGLKGAGTEGAGRFLVTPSQLGSLLAKLPANWPQKNLQLVLHTKIISNTPTRAELLVSHLW